MVKVVIVGGGWAGCTAAFVASKLDAEVTLIEKSDTLLGCGLAAGITENNGRYTATKELEYLGCGELLDTINNATVHESVDLPGHHHTKLYDPVKVEPQIRKILKNMGVNLYFRCRADDVVVENKKINEVILSNEMSIDGDVFVDATGSAGPMGNCLKYGNGCSICVLRCPSFGPRVSISGRAGINELASRRNKDEGFGAFSGACTLIKETLDEELKSQLEENGFLIIPDPNNWTEINYLDIKACQQYASPIFKKNIILLDTGTYAKLMKPFYPLEELRKLDGFENVMYAHPQRSDSNSIRFLSRAPRNNALKVKGIKNLFCAGEKSGFFVGCVEAMATGFIAGYNSVNYSKKKKLLKLPSLLSVGDIILYENERVKTGDLKNKYTFSGGLYFQRMKNKGLYMLNDDDIKNKVKKVLKDECESCKSEMVE